MVSEGNVPDITAGAKTRAMAGLMLLAAWYGLALLLVLGVMSVDGLVLAQMFTPYIPGWQITPVQVISVLATIPALSAVVYGCLISGSRAPDHDSIVLTRDEAPQLWKIVDKVVREADSHSKAGHGLLLRGDLRTRTRPPTMQLRLSCRGGAASRESGGLFGLREGVRVLYVGVPLLAGLRPDDLRAVLSHEIAGHFSGGLTRFKRRVHRGTVALTNSYDMVLNWGLENPAVRFASLPVRLPLFWINRLYQYLSKDLERQFEFHADAAAAALAGGSAAYAAALSHAHQVSAAWDTFLRADFHQSHAAAADCDPFTAFADTLRNPATQERLAREPLHLDDPLSKLRDTHPPLRERLARLHQDWTPFIPSDDISLFSEIQWLLPELTDQVHIDLGDPTPFPDTSRQPWYFRNPIVRHYRRRYAYYEELQKQDRGVILRSAARQKLSSIITLIGFLIIVGILGYIRS